MRTLAVQVSEELFQRFKEAVAKKGCKQKDFLIAIIKRAVEESEAESGEEKMSGAPDARAGMETPLAGQGPGESGEAKEESTEESAEEAGESEESGNEEASEADDTVPGAAS